jgi:glycosyltransferase involved in cell wall biosynthesis
MSMLKRICFLENGTTGGGSFSSLYSIVTNLDRSLYDPVVVFVNHTSYVDKLRDAGIETKIFFDPLYSLESGPVAKRVSGYARFAAHSLGAGVSITERMVHRSTINDLMIFMRDSRIDLLHCNNNPVRDYYGIAASWRLGVPCVSHMRSLRVGNASNNLTPSIVLGVTQFIANSTYCASFWIDNFNLPSDKVTVIPNALSVKTSLAVDVRQTWGISENSKVIGCVANFAVGKGQEFLLESFYYVAQQMPDVVLLFVGDGYLLPRIKERAQDLDLADSVRFVGYSDKARSIIADCDVMVVPSETEAFGRTVLEAMNEGTPVIGTRVGGIPEIIKDGQNGLLIKYGDTRELSQSLVKLVQDSAYSDRLAVAGINTAIDYSIDTHITSITGIYEKIFANC